MDDCTLTPTPLQTKEIPLSQGKFAIVDAADYEWLMQWNWHAEKQGNLWYARRNIKLANGRWSSAKMHRDIMGVTPGVTVDHKDGNGLNNTRGNLRPCTQAQNVYNQSLRSDNISGFRGVSWRADRKRWRAIIQVDGKQRNIGLYPSAEDAARAYDEFAKRIYGEFAKLNFAD